MQFTENRDPTKDHTEYPYVQLWKVHRGAGHILLDDHYKMPNKESSFFKSVFSCTWIVEKPNFSAVFTFMRTERAYIVKRSLSDTKSTEARFQRVSDELVTDW